MMRHPWANMRPGKDPPLQPSCVHVPACVAFLVAPACRCGGELATPCRTPTEGEVRGCFVRCGGRLMFASGAWWPASKLPEQWAPERVHVRPNHLRVA
jgi:hypothetical protein